MRRWSAVPLALAALLCSAAAHAQPYTFRWDASSGLLPDLGCPFGGRAFPQRRCVDPGNDLVRLEQPLLHGPGA